MNRRARELAILHQVARATSAVVDSDELISQTTELIGATLYSDIFGFVLMDEERGVLVPHPSYRGIPREFHGALIPTERSIVGAVFSSGEPYIVTDVQNEPLYFEGVRSTRSEIAVPLKVHGRVIGVINVESPIPNAFSDSDAHFLVTLAGQVAAAVERARLYKELERRADELAEEVTERTAELQSERDRTLTILESAGESIVLTDAQLNIVYVNPAMERQSGYSAEELISQSPRILENPTSSADAYDQMWSTTSAGASWSGELVYRRKDGALYDVSMTLSPIRDAGSELSGFVGVLSDISRLKDLDRLKTQFVSTISHELRTPLTNIKMYLTLLERGKEEKRRRYLDILNVETERLERLIQDLLDLSRLDTQATSELPAPIDILQSVQELVRELLETAEQQQVTLQIEPSPALPSVSINKDHLTKLLTNLVGNALAYTPAGGRVLISTGTDHQNGRPMVWLRVLDDGPGIPRQEMSRLFDRFYRGEAALTTGAPGTGLGLAICREIVTRYGGDIDVESEPGGGACFTAWLPAAS